MLKRENNPWKGLTSYTYSDAGLFFGRDRDMASLSESIWENDCTVLYGASGVGKTSLIGAGLCPRLEKEGILPVLLRLDHKTGKSYSGQILDACLAELSRCGCECESSIETTGLEFSDTDRLWLFFHASTLWSLRNEKLIPCVFIDPFEEIFTLNDKTPSKISAFFNEFNELIQPVPSDGLLSVLNDLGKPVLINDRTSFRMVISLREDFVSRLDDYCRDIPCLRRNRRRLNKLSGIQAMDVITKPSPGVIDSEAARLIITKVIGKEIPESGFGLDKVEVETSILSLFCSDLYDKAADGGYETITPALVKAQGNDILKDFYLRSIKGLPKKTVNYLESHLLTSGGFRNQLAVEDADKSILSDTVINQLEQARVIKKEFINGTLRIEFSHDVLIDVAKEHRRLVRDRGKNNGIVFGILRWVMTALLGWLLVRQRNSYFVPARYDIENRSVSFLLFDGHAVLFNLTLVLLVFLGLFIYAGMLSLASAGRKNNGLSCLVSFIAIGYFSFIFDLVPPRFGYLSWEGPMVLVFMILLTLVFHGRKSTFSEAFRYSFAPEEIRNDRRKGFIVAGMIFLALFVTYRSNLVKSSWMTLVSLIMILPLFIGVLYMLGHSAIDPVLKKRGYCSSVLLAVLAPLFVLSTYSHIRVLSYTSLMALFVAGLMLSRSFFHEPKRWLQITLSALFWLFCPLYSLGFSLFALGENARTGAHPVECLHPLYNRGIWEPVGVYPRYVPIESKDGEVGLISNEGMVLAPRFRRLLDEYSVIDSENPPYHSWPVERFFVETIQGDVKTWDVSNHLDEDNLLTRRYMREYWRSPYGVISTRSILSGLDYSSDTSRFDEFAERLFFNELDFSLGKHEDSSYGGLYFNLGLWSSSGAHDSLRRMLDFWFWYDYDEKDDHTQPQPAETLCDSLLSAIIANGPNKPVYELFSESLEAISKTDALESAALRDRLESFISAYLMNNPSDWRMHHDLAVVLLHQGRYSEAEAEARQAAQLTDDKKPVVPLLESLLLQGEYAECNKIMSEDANSIISRNIRQYYGYLSPYLRKDKLFGDPDCTQSYVGDIVLSDTLRYSYTGESLSFIKERLAGYGDGYGYSRSYGDVVGEIGSLSEDMKPMSASRRGGQSAAEGLNTLICKESPSKPQGRNWYEVVLRRGAITSEKFDRITLSDYPYPSVYFVGDKRGYIDIAGKDFTPRPPLYDHAWVYSEGIAVVISEGKLVFIDVQGKVIAEPDVTAINDMDLVFKKGTLLYRNDNNLYGLLGKSGKWVLPPEYESIGVPDSGGNRLVMQKGLFGLVRSDGSLALEPKFPRIDMDDEFIYITLPDGIEAVRVTRRDIITGDALAGLGHVKSVLAEDDGWLYYKVRRGDSIKSIASSHGMSVKDFCSMNGLQSESVLRVGQLLKVGLR